MLRENKYFQIQGKVHKDVLAKLHVRKLAKQNTEWLYVDYSPIELPLNTKLDVIMLGNQLSGWKLPDRFYSIKLLDVIDQTGKELSGIPIGWKTMCRFEFKPMPLEIDQLKVLTSWGYESALCLARHEDIELSPEVIDQYVYTEVINDFINICLGTPEMDDTKKLIFLDTISNIIVSNPLALQNKVGGTDFIEAVKRREFQHH